MTAATPFPTPWGYDQLVGHNSTNIINASLSVWKQSAASGMAQDFTIGMIPLLLLTVVYIRTKKITPSLLVGLISTIGLDAFNLVSSGTAISFYIIFSLGIALSIGYWLFNTN